jgi:hypothetical protein
MSDKTTRSITCDGCSKELIKDSSYPNNYILELKSKDVAVNSTGLTYAVMMYPKISSTKHFCNTKCLGEWLKNDSL